MSRDQQERPAVSSGYKIGPRSDLADLAELWIASWEATMPAIDFTARREWFCATVAAVEAAGGRLLCARDGRGELAGFVLLDLRHSRIEQIAVAPAHFGSGLGAILIRCAKDLCPSGLALTVNTDNPRALRFYEKHGFEPAGQGINPRSGLAVRQLRWPGR